MKRKMMIAFLVIVVLLICLIGRILFIQFVNGDKYTKIVLAQQDYTNTTIPYRRGDITDRKGTLLATSTQVYNIVLDCKVVNADEDDIEPTIQALAKCLDNYDESDIRSILTDYSTSQYYVLEKKQTREEIEELQEIIDDDENYPNVSGIWFETEYEREYPYDSLASAVIGFTTSGNEGMSGLENYYNDELNGTDGRQYGYLDEDSDYESTIVEPTDGNTLVTTIDTNIQSIVEKYIKKFNKKYANNARKGDGSEHTGVIVMDPDTGEILAMANYPNYDLNDPWDLSSLYSDSKIEKMDEDEELDALNELWQNFCITYTYEPGSTIKPFTVATGLDTGTLSGNETYVCNGGQQVGDHYIHCVNRSGHGTLTIEEALMESCNDALMQMSFSIGATNLSKYQSIFGFGSKTNVDLPGEARTDTLVYSADEMNKTTLATNSFGQNFNVTMIQLATGFSSLINGGYYYQPHVVKEIDRADGSVEETIDATLLKETISEETSEQLKEYLLAVVEDGTGSAAGVKGYEIGGKTGTAQKLPRGDGNYLVSFIGYAPQDDPEVVVYVVVDEPNVDDQAHSSYAQEIAHNIFKEVLPYMNIEKEK